MVLSALWGSLGLLLGALGSLLGVFWEVLGGSEAHFGAYTFKRGGVAFPSRRFWLIFEKKVEILGPEKGSPIGPKMAPKKVAKKIT